MRPMHRGDGANLEYIAEGKAVKMSVFLTLLQEVTDQIKVYLYCQEKFAP